MHTLGPLYEIGRIHVTDIGESLIDAPTSDKTRGMHITTDRRLSKIDCDKFSAIRTNDNRIEILEDGMPWMQYNSPSFVFRRRIAILLIDSIDILSKYIDEDGKYPDWNGPRAFGNYKHLLSVEKFGHDWQRPTGYLRLIGHVEVEKPQRKQLGLRKALGVWCTREQIQSIIDKW